MDKQAAMGLYDKILLSKEEQTIYNHSRDETKWQKPQYFLFHLHKILENGWQPRVAKTHQQPPGMWAARPDHKGKQHAVEVTGTVTILVAVSHVYTNINVCAVYSTPAAAQYTRWWEC